VQRSRLQVYRIRTLNNLKYLFFRMDRHADKCCSSLNSHMEFNIFRWAVKVNATLDRVNGTEWHLVVPKMEQKEEEKG
jgi:hypothetical protein